MAGLAALTSAAINGIWFVGTGQNGASLAMAWAVALLYYLSITYIAARHGGRRGTPRWNRGRAEVVPAE